MPEALPIKIAWIPSTAEIGPDDLIFRAGDFPETLNGARLEFVPPPPPTLVERNRRTLARPFQWLADRIRGYSLQEYYDA